MDNVSPAVPFTEQNWFIFHKMIHGAVPWIIDSSPFVKTCVSFIARTEVQIEFSQLGALKQRLLYESLGGELQKMGTHV